MVGEVKSEKILRNGGEMYGKASVKDIIKKYNR